MPFQFKIGTQVLHSGDFIVRFAHIVFTESSLASICGFNHSINAKGFDSWFGACFVLLVGAAMFELTRREFLRQWGQVQEEIEREIKRREAAI